MALPLTMASKFATMMVLTNKVAKGQGGERSENFSFFLAIYIKKIMVYWDKNYPWKHFMYKMQRAFSLLKQ